MRRARSVRSAAGRSTKLPSSPAIQFKGSGWYITDYARAGKSDSVVGAGERARASGSRPTREERLESDAKSKTESKQAETKTETKTETKSDTKPATPSTS